MTIKDILEYSTSVSKELISIIPCPDKNFQKKKLTDKNIKTGDFLGQGRGLFDIPHYEDSYAITIDGRILNKKRQTWLAQNDLGRGWLKVELWKNGQRKNFKVHRLVALTFIPNPENKPAINHIDGNKQNNHTSNLEWVTNQENTDHAKVNNLMWFQKESYAG